MGVYELGHKQENFVQKLMEKMALENSEQGKQVRELGLVDAFKKDFTVHSVLEEIATAAKKLEVTLTKEQEIIAYNKIAKFEGGTQFEYELFISDCVQETINGDW